MCTKLQVLLNSAIMPYMANGTKRSLAEVENAIEQLTPAEQARLVNNLAHILSDDVSGQSLLRLAESSFQFWDNPDDSAYDRV